MRHDIDQARDIVLRQEEYLYSRPPKVKEEVKAEESSGDAMDVSIPAAGVPDLEFSDLPEDRASAHVQARIQYIWETKGLSAVPEEALSEEQVAEKVRIELDQWLSYLRNGLHT